MVKSVSVHKIWGQRREKFTNVVNASLLKISGTFPHAL